MNNKCFLVCFLLVLILTITATPSFGSYAQTIDGGMNWLLQSKLGNDYWGASTSPEMYIDELPDDSISGTSFRDTCVATRTLQIFAPSSVDYFNAIESINRESVIATEYISRRIVVLAPAGKDISLDLNTLLSYQHGCFGGYKQTPCNPLDTALALQALKAANYSDASVLFSAINFLTTNQNSDGGWGFRPASGALTADPSNAYVTAMVLRALAVHSTQFIVQGNINKAKAYLLTKQNTDGGFGSSPSNVYETALSVMALIESGQADVMPLQNGIAYLTSTQLPDGSWNDDPYETALALQALAKVKPNLSIASSDIAFSQTSPVMGDPVTITVSVHNSGLGQADNVLVKIYDGDPSAGGAAIGSFSIPAISPGAAEQLSIVYALDKDTDRHAIHVVVDPLNTISELNENDNAAVNYYTLFSPPDLYVDNSATSYMPTNPTIDLPLLINFVIGNNGEKETASSSAALYRGLPVSGGVLIDTYTIPSLQGHSSYTLTVPINAPNEGLDSYYLIVDPENVITEIDETNNQGMISIPVANHRATDLSLNASGLSFIFPNGIIAGNECELSALVTNAGSTNVATTVSFYSGDPAAGGVLIGTSAITVPALGSQTARINWTVPQDKPIIYGLVDAANLILETDETNNTAMKPLDGTYMLPDLSIEAADISYYPSCITPQTIFTVNATFHNWGGNADPRGFTYLYTAIYDGAPENGGVKKGGFEFVLTQAIGSGGSSSTSIGQMMSQTGSVSLGSLSQGTHELYVVADYNNQIEELSETNNRAVLRIDVTNDCPKDLSISSKDITFTPPLPVTGSQVMINAKVRNFSTKSENFYVAYYNGNPAMGGALIRRVNTSVGQQNSQNVQTSFTMPAGVPDVYVVVDDNNQVVETDETNNVASRTIDTYKNDLLISPGDITLSSTAPGTGDSVTANVMVHSTGTTTLSGTLSLYEGSPEHGNLIGSKVIEVPGNQTSTFGFPSYKYPGGGLTLTALIENVLPSEYDVTNNRASATFGEHIAQGSTNEGTDFWLAWPPAYYDTANIVIQSKHEAHVTVTLPYTGLYTTSLPMTLALTVTPGAPAFIPLTGIIYGEINKTNSVIEDKGIHVTSDKDVSVIFHTPAYSNYADDSYLALPTTTLGTKYYVLSYTAVYNASYTIVASEDSTNVTVAGQTIRLNKGQTYVYNARMPKTTDLSDVTGALVTSDKPIGVIASTFCSFVPSDPQVYYCNSLLEQMLPTSLVGKDYYTAPLYSPVGGERYRILALEDDTTVSVKDKYRTQTLTLNAGEWDELDRENALHITSSNPVMVAQFSKGIDSALVGDPFHLTIIPTELFRTEYRFFSYQGYGGFNWKYPQYTEQGNFATIIALEPDTQVTLDGMLLDADWQALPDRGNSAMVHLDSGEHVVSANKPVAVYVHGYGDSTGYGYPGGFSVNKGNLRMDNASSIPAFPTMGSLVELAADLTNEGGRSINNVVVQAYNGDPATDGIPIGAEIFLPVLGPKEIRKISIVWDSQGSGGVNKIYIVADPMNSIPESIESDNITMVPVTIAVPNLPDLTVTPADVAISPNTPMEGAVVDIMAKIRNRGSATGAVPVSLYLGSPEEGGKLLATKVIEHLMPPNTEAVVEFSVSTLGWEALNTLTVAIDENNSIEEILETNNQAVLEIPVLRKKAVLTATTDNDSYQAGIDIGIFVTAQNLNTASLSGTGTIRIETPDNQAIATVATFSLDDLKPWGMEGWRYRIPVIVSYPRDLKDATAMIKADFADILDVLGASGNTVDKNSVRVLEFTESGLYKGEKQVHTDFLTDSTARIRWLMDGLSTVDVQRYFDIYFSIADSMPKSPASANNVPVIGRMIAYGDVYGKIMYIEQNPDGTYSGPKQANTISYPTTGNTRGIVIDDFNNDGYADILTGSYVNTSPAHGEIYYFANKADGSNGFMPAVKVSEIPGAGSGFMDAASADFNNDGNRDFVLNIASGTINLFLGNGDGTFKQTTIPLPTSLDSRMINGKVAADFDNDGYVDLAFATYGGIFLSRGNGDGTFLTLEKVGELSYTVAYGLTAGDFDEDGIIDLVAGKDLYGDAYFLKGKGDGAFMPPTATAVFDTDRSSTFDSGDFNGDGHLDVLVDLTSTGRLLYYPGRGDGTFSAFVTLASTTVSPLIGISSHLGSQEIHTNIGTPELTPSEVFPFTWNTGSTWAGSYKVKVSLAEGETIIAETSSPFAIEPDMSSTATVITDKISYNPNESATIAATITSQSANYAFENLTAKLTVASSQTGSSIVSTETRTITNLMPGAAFNFKNYWNTGTNTAGTYPVTLEVKDSAGTVIATATSSIVINNVVKPSKTLRGQVTVDQQSILSGDPVTVSYTVTNVGNADLSNVSLSVKTVHVKETTVYDTLTSQASITMGGAYTQTAAIDTARYSAMDYLVVLQASIDNGPEETIAGSYFRVEGAPTTPSLASPAMGTDVRTLAPVLTVNNSADPNDDKLTYEFEIYGDSSLSQLVAATGGITPGTGSTSLALPFEQTENQTYFWRVRAFDGKLYSPWMQTASFRVNVANDPPGAPIPTSPMDGTEVSTLQPMLTVTNAADPDSTGLTYNFDISLDPDFTQVVSTATGVAEGPGTTSWVTTPGLTENTWYWWRAQADDWLATGPWSTTSRFFVNTANDAPTTPVVLSPINNAVVSALAVDITVQNSTDPDSSVLSYFYELDTVPTFDSTGIIRSGSVSENQGSTTWQATGLQDNTQYYLRSKASDGSAESGWSDTIGFFVNTANDPPTTPVIANPSNGAGVSVFTPTLTVRNSTDPDRDVLTYEFELYADEAITNLVANTFGIAETADTTSWTEPVTLTENRTYWWRSRASDDSLTSGWTQASSFTVNTANDAPSTPEILSPSAGSTVETRTPTLIITNATDPDSDNLTYEFEVYAGSTLVWSTANVAEGADGTTSIDVSTSLPDSSQYQWRSRAFDGDRYGPWTALATFTVHLPQTGIIANIEVEPETLNQKSEGTWVTVEIELPHGYKTADVDISSIRLEGIVRAIAKPYGETKRHQDHGCREDRSEHDHGELKVKFKRNEVIAVLPAGNKVPVHVTGTVGTTTFEGVDIIRAIK